MPTTPQRRGLLVSAEGITGSGKTAAVNGGYLPGF
jgi:hypothetical protein